MYTTGGHGGLTYYIMEITSCESFGKFLLLHPLLRREGEGRETGRAVSAAVDSQGDNLFYFNQFDCSR